ncbi:PSME3-interacting protein-like [Dendronephthya gigantea]|uniref:PSME3-interacting protein-like n=1 Tax=Dendronephthya gigantea TaxID=151771 RepID=UPI00106D0A54|nr:PSME3-interacting protein-like [Dendronephthya gigantea]
MSFKKSNKNIKSFVSEEEAKDLNEKRQKEWERVRQPDDPVECPDHVETRSLFEQLQEQKEKSQQEHDEKYDIKKMFRGIDNDEAVFLEFASKQQAEIDGRRFAVTPEVKEFRNEVASLQTMPNPSSVLDEKEKRKSNVMLGKKKSQVELLAGCIKTKRKRSDTNSSEDEKSVEKMPANPDETLVPSEVVKDDVRKSSHLEDKAGVSSRESEKLDRTGSIDIDNTTVAQQIGYIPSLGIYSDSSDSESSSSDSDILPSLFTNFTSKAQ